MKLMDEINKSQKIKLKPIRLKDLLFNYKLRIETNNIKTERPIQNSRNYLYSINKKKPALNTLNSTFLSKNNKTIINLKNKTPRKKKKFQGIIPIKKENKTRKRKYIDLNEGYTNYLKEKTNKIYRRMKHLLFQEKIKKLSLPKYRHIINNENKTTYNSVSTRYNYSNKKDEHYQLNQNYKYKKHLHDNHLFEKEKIKERKRFNAILQINFKKLDSCETKFNTAVDKTMKLLSEYQRSLGHLKSEK